MNAADLLSDLDLTDEELPALLDLAAAVKERPGDYSAALTGKSIALLFEKPSLRTKLTFELAIKQLGGDCVSSDGQLGVREPLKDVARNLDRWVNGIVARVFAHATVTELAKWSSVPVINALCDVYHPCQALADVQTMMEHWGEVRGRKLAFIGDGNNVAHSLMLSAARLGMDFSIGCPKGFDPDAEVVAQAEGLAAIAGGKIEVVHDAAAAVKGAHAVYTDVWASMGQEDQAARRRAAFRAFQVDEKLMAKAEAGALFMHCLPAKRGEEVTDEVMESAASVVFDQAENRLHAQKALLLMSL
jgi:ornithine carbamoyltransferase